MSDHADRVALTQQRHAKHGPEVARSARLAPNAYSVSACTSAMWTVLPSSDGPTTERLSGTYRMLLHEFDELRRIAETPRGDNASPSSIA